MCNKPIAWVVDKSAKGQHVLVPVTCDDYIVALEGALEDVLEWLGGPDSAAWPAVRKSLGIEGPMLHDDRKKRE